MSKEMVCITCPMGCHLTVELPKEGEVQVSGNRCPRGVVYAREETLAPKRVVTATCRITRRGGSVQEAARPESLAAPRRVSCRTTAAFPKDMVPALLKELYALDLPLPVNRGEVILKDALGTGIDVVATRTIE
jgi:CxxC motif-containing protein